MLNYSSASEFDLNDENSKLQQDTNKREQCHKHKYLNLS